MAYSNGYGTVATSRAAHNGSLPEDDTDLLGRKPHVGLAARLHGHLNVDVNKKWGDTVLLSCYTITGLLDSSSTLSWGSFASMQTGNTIYFGLGLVAPADGTRWLRAGISIACFSLGSFFFSRWHHYLGNRRRWVLVTSYTIQLLFIMIAALIVTFDPNIGKERPLSVSIGLPLALLAFQSAGQAVSSRALQYSSLTSVVLTSIYCDLFSDQNIFTTGITENADRNRRAAAPTLLLIGAILGGLWAHSDFGMAGGLWTAVVLKALVVLAWLVWAADPEESED